jgi:hypothetical protein
MQIVNFTKDYFDFIQKNTLLTLEQAQWFTQNEGFIPLPRKCNEKNTYVIFSERHPHFFLTFKEKKIKQYRISKVSVESKPTWASFEEYIIVVELEKSKFNTHYYFDSFYGTKIIHKTKLPKAFSNSKIKVHI